MENKTKWILDPAHSEIVFKVRHLMLTNVTGAFEKFTSEFTSSIDDMSKANISAIIEASSICTHFIERDNHLKSADFFDVENHKNIRFESDSFIKLDNLNYKLNGRLTIKGIAKKVSFDVEYAGVNKDPWGNQKAGFSLNGKINRKDWGLSYNVGLESGGFLIGDEIKIAAEIQFLKQD
ncbi:hypothetical protein CNR22_15905 [Sphingobacteriaceae bacterium]|nr:hypothetical protein CNR22_15905 [Sphingobacteriaceae bacterium]